MSRRVAQRAIASEPNGARTDRTTHDALAELGASVLEILGSVTEPMPDETPATLGDVLVAARSLGLLPESEVTP